MSTWRYIAQRISGPSAGTFLDWNLPVSSPEIETALGANSFSFKMSPPKQLALAEDGFPLIDKWCTAVWAERDGSIVGGGIVSSNAFDGPTWEVSCVGYAAYPQGYIFQDNYQGIQVDPLDVVRMLWSWIQNRHNSNLNMRIPNTKSPVRIGTEPRDVKFTTGDGEDVEFEAGPYKLDWWDNPDIGQEIDNLKEETPFECSESHFWNDDKSEIIHKLNIGYPRLGRRRHDLRFVLGENIAAEPSAKDGGEDFANYGIGVGAGEGAKTVHVTVPQVDHRLQRHLVVEESGTKTKRRLTAQVRKQVERTQVPFTVEEIKVIDHENAPLGSWQPGDDIRVRGRLDWLELDVWMRVKNTVQHPEDESTVTVQLELI